MRLIRFLVFVGLAALTAMSGAVPAILIVRVRPPKGEAALPTAVCDFLANEFQSGGRVVPIVWGLTDPIYRAAVQEGKIRSGNETPTLDEALAIAGKLHAEYVLATDIRAGQGEVLGAAALYRSGRQIWKDPNVDLGPALAHLREMLKKKQISRDDYNESVLKASYRTSAIQFNSKLGADDTVRSFARTWAEMIQTGPLASLPQQTQKETPDPGKGQIPGSANTNPVKPADSVKWKAEVDAALKSGDAAKAVSVLRDAVDSAPMDVDRRMSLIRTLVQVGQPEVAAKEARRAAELMPDKLDFRLAAARSWIQAGNVEEAQTDLNEAVSRSPEAPQTRMLLAEVAMAKQDFAGAVDHLNKSIAAGPSGDAYYFRGLAHAMLGDLDLALADIKKASDVGLSQDPQDSQARYGLVAALFDESLSAIAGDIRTLHQKAQVLRTDKDLAVRLADLVKRVSGRTRFISELPAPPSHELSHNRRILAYKLLSQCLVDLGSYLESGDGDVLTDSRINLGEALKQDASARQEFKSEQQQTRKSDGKPG